MISLAKQSGFTDICVVTGFLHEQIEQAVQDIPGVTIVYNPFYAVTNSIASLWFARDYLEGGVVIANSDVVVAPELFADIVDLDTPAAVMIDSSKLSEADYRVATFNDRVVMMSKELNTFTGEYVGITKLAGPAAKELCVRTESMIHAGQIDEWYENALVHMILNDDFELRAHDVARWAWTEVDTVDDLVAARSIYESFD